jgi:hypothetical protein
MRLGGNDFVRRDLESAMGAALTSRSARDMVADDPGAFATHFGLTPAETAVLAGMAGDLADLTPGFVHKRERGLRQALGVTLSLLGGEAAALIEDYAELYAPLSSHAEETLRFADFLVAQARELVGDLAYGEVIADVANFERLRLRSFHAEGPLWPEPEKTPLDPGHIDPGRPLWLHRSAAVERFGWDVRSVRSPQALPRLRPDPANLLCVQREHDGEVLALRIGDEAARAVGLIAAQPGGLTAGQVMARTAPGRPPEEIIGKLIVQGAVRGEPS